MLTEQSAVKRGFTRKRCPKCGGNVFLDKDRDMRGWYEQCLQCGRTFDLPDVVEVGVKGALGRATVRSFQN